MTELAIRVEGLGKQYRIGGASSARYATLRDTLARTMTAPLRRLRRPWSNRQTKKKCPTNDRFWALNDLSFDVCRGEVVGIIGRNGAGKSTLLKILSRITEPTAGTADVYGRVGSLLEVGTGFHPELTGRENIFLNGAILGMTRREIQQNFDEIVAFAEVERFIDTAVKHYSSGMYLRLAFAVAAHLKPEILLVDEVLAVGDARFQKKCLNKMQDVGQQGRTVLFISHNMPSVTRLCKRTILLEDGRALKDGPSHEVVSAYLNNGFGTSAEREWSDAATAPGAEVARLRALRLRTKEGRITDAVDIRRPIGIEMEFETLQPGYVLLPLHHVHNEEGVHVFSTHDLDPDWRGRRRPVGRWVSTAWIPANFMSEGTFFVSSEAVTLDPMIPQFYERDVLAFQVIDDLEGDSSRGDWVGRMGGVVRPYLQWNNRFSPNGHAASHLQP